MPAVQASRAVTIGHALMNDRWKICLTGWQKIGWALDEDLRQVRAALEGGVDWVSLPRSRVVVSAWPAALLAIPPAALAGKRVVCLADNPPSFYLTTEGFACAASRVDLWVARTHEAMEQFRALDLPAVLVPYHVEETVFQPLSQRHLLRSGLGIGEEAFVVGNFHRDSEGADLTKPKIQKGPDLLLEIARRLHHVIPGFTVLLAGPRRHWLMEALRSEGIPAVFAGMEPGDRDDYPQNILSKERLNELYQALDAAVISSRWEGGPYTALEAVLAGCPLFSTPVGTARELLPKERIFEEPDSGAAKIQKFASSGGRQGPERLEIKLREQTLVSHGATALSESLLGALQSFPKGGISIRECLRSLLGLIGPRKQGQAHKRIAALHCAVRELARKAPPRIQSFWPTEGSLQDLLECSATIIRAKESAPENNKLPTT